MTLTPLADLEPAECVILAVAHDDYLRDGWALLGSLLADGSGSVVDVKRALPRESTPASVQLWRL